MPKLGRYIPRVTNYSNLELDIYDYVCIINLPSD